MLIFNSRKGIIHLGVLVTIVFSLIGIAAVNSFAGYRSDGQRSFGTGFVRKYCEKNPNLKYCSKSKLPAPDQPNNPSSNKISWKTPYASLEADDFYINVNGKKFVGKGTMQRLVSNQGINSNQTLEVEWLENDTLIRIYFIFRSDGQSWRVSDVKTYHGNARGEEWVYFAGFEGNKLGEPLIKTAIDLQLIVSSQNVKVHFDNLKLLPFQKAAGCITTPKPILRLDPRSVKPNALVLAVITAHQDCVGLNAILERDLVIAGVESRLGTCNLLRGTSNVECKIQFNAPDRPHPGGFGYYNYHTAIDLDHNNTPDFWSDSAALFVEGDLAESSPVPSPSVSPNLDSDGDGFKDSLEIFIGTNPSLRCGANAWPPDINSDKTIDLANDILAVVNKQGTNERRYDLNGDGTVNSNDVDIVKSYVGKICT